MESVILIILAALILFIAFTFFKGKGNSSVDPAVHNPDLDNQPQAHDGEGIPEDYGRDSGSSWDEDAGNASGDDAGSDEDSNSGGDFDFGGSSDDNSDSGSNVER